jgi:hypothetical protein
MMTPGEPNESVYTTYDLSGFGAGSELKVLFKADGGGRPGASRRLGLSPHQA